MLIITQRVSRTPPQVTCTRLQGLFHTVNPDFKRLLKDQRVSDTDLKINKRFGNEQAKRFCLLSQFDVVPRV